MLGLMMNNDFKRILLLAASFSFVMWLAIWMSQRSNTLSSAIRQSELNSLDKYVFGQIVDDPRWNTDDLLARMFGPSHSSTIVWIQSFLIDDEPHTLCLADQSIRSIAGSPVPLIALLFRGDGKLVYWKEVAPYSIGFENAQISRDEETDAFLVSVSAKLNWTRGIGTWKYLIGRDDMFPIGKVSNVPVDGESSRHKWLAPIKDLADYFDATSSGK